MPSEDDRHAARAMTLAIARSVIAGEVSILLASRELARLRFSAAEDHSDADFLTFVAIESETDHLPIGDERRYWAAPALAEKDAEIAEAETWAREFGLDACRRLIKRFSDAG